MNDALPLIIVNERDEPVGTGEKLSVHREGLLHRAFSVFIVNTAGQLLLQQRAESKYHSGGLWTNTCCGHATPGETIEQSAARRLREEMGMEGIALSKLFTLHYTAPLAGGLVENEIDHVFVGVSDAAPTLNPDEARDYSYDSISSIKDRLSADPDAFTAWFAIIMERHLHRLLPAILEG